MGARCDRFDIFASTSGRHPKPFACHKIRSGCRWLRKRHEVVEMESSDAPNTEKWNIRNLPVTVLGANMVWKGAIAIVSKFFLGHNLVFVSSHIIWCQNECLAQLISHCRMHDYLCTLNDFSESKSSFGAWDGIIAGYVGGHISQSVM